MSLASLLTVLNSPWTLGIATVLLILTSDVLVCGPEPPWGLWLVRWTVFAFFLWVVGVNFLHTFGWLS